MTRTQFLQRASAALCGTVCLAGTAVILNSVESRSALVLAAVAAGSCAGLAFLFLAFSRASIWDSTLNRVRWLLTPCENPSCEDRVEPKRVSLLLIAVGLIGYLLLVAMLFPQNDGFAGEDEEAYLITARQISDSGGTLAFLKSLYAGEFAEANRHPLYLWLLSGTPDFGPAKAVSVIMGLWTFGLVIGLCVQSQLGWIRTGLLCAMLGLNGAWARFSVTVGCEVLLVGLVACVWFQFFRKPISQQDSGEPCQQSSGSRGDLRVIGASVLLALVWLTKGTGLLLTIGFVAWLVIKKLRPVPSPPGGEGTGSRPVGILRELFVFGAVWVAVASPLLMRNVVRYGSPFYNVNSWLLFVDEYSDPVALSESSTIGEAATEYLASHSIGDILKREATGLFWDTYILVRSLGPPHPDDDRRVVPGAMIALLAILGWLVSRGEEKWLLLIWLAICLPLFAWYVPVAAGERFVLPLLVPILCYAAEGPVHLAGKIAGQRT